MAGKASTTYIFDNELIDSIKSGNFTNVNHRPFYNYSYIPILIPPQKAYTFYLHIESIWKNVTAINYSIHSYQYAFSSVDKKTPERYEYNFFNGLFFGIIIFIILFSLIKYILEWDKAYLVYIIYLLAISFYYLVKRSSNLVTFLSSYAEKVFLYNTTISYLVYGSYLIFIVVFLNIHKKEHRYLFYSISSLICLLTIAIIIDLALQFTSSNSLLIEIHLWIRSIAVPIILVVIIQLFKTMRKNRAALFIITGTLLLVAFGWLSDFIGEIEKNINNNIYDPRAETFSAFLWPPIAHAQFGALLDVLCFSLGLSYRSKKQLQETEQEIITTKVAKLEAERQRLEAKQALTKSERIAVELKLEKVILNQRISASELKALKAQIKPHFIGNALNSIKLLIQQREKKKAASYLSKFASLMRQILDHSKEQLIYLEQELLFCKSYLEIESLRFECQFKYIVQIDKNVMIDELKVPPLILQPYLENAIWHGLIPKKGSRILKLNIEKDDKGFKCVIEDNGIGRENAAAKSRLQNLTQSHGMSITNERLNLSNELFETQFKVKLIDLEDNYGKPLGTRVELFITA